MDTSWVIVGLVVMSLLGSLSWALPSAAQRAQGKLRAQAMQMGLRVKIVKLKGPRKRGQTDAIERMTTSYSVFRSDQDTKALGRAYQWQIFRANGADTQNLPDGWCWHKRDAMLAEEQLQQLVGILSDLPADVCAITGTSLAVEIYWDERGVPDDVTKIVSILTVLRTAKI